MTKIYDAPSEGSRTPSPPPSHTTTSQPCYGCRYKTTEWSWKTITCDCGGSGFQSGKLHIQCNGQGYLHVQLCSQCKGGSFKARISQATKAGLGRKGPKKDGNGGGHDGGQAVAV